MSNLENPRQVRGIDIAKRYTLKEENGTWFVPSASGKSKRYQVCLKSNNCTCPDYEIRKEKCKHLWAVEYSFEQSFLDALDTLEVAKVAKQRKTYKQDWKAYNQAQTSENAVREKIKSVMLNGHHAYFFSGCIGRKQTAYQKQYARYLLPMSTSILTA